MSGYTEDIEAWAVGVDLKMTAVMGWKQASGANRLGVYDGKREGDFVVYGNSVSVAAGGSYPEVFTRQWRPSDSMLDTMEVLERVRDLGFDVELHIPHDSPLGRWPTCFLRRFVDGKIEREESISAPTLELAICHAALKAVTA